MKNPMLLSWRRAMGLKQGALAAMLGVSQTAVSRWENGLDQPSAETYARLRSLIDQQSLIRQGIDQRIIEKQPGLRALVDLDGITLLATSQAFKFVWPEMVAAEGSRLADHLVSFSHELFHDGAMTQSIRQDEIAMISGVSDRHIDGFGDQSFRHYWAATYRKIGMRHYAEISYDACQPDAELGFRHILRIDEIG